MSDDLEQRAMSLGIAIMVRMGAWPDERGRLTIPYPKDLDDILFAALSYYGAACAAAERERAAQVALELGWRDDASDAMRVAATTIAAAIRRQG